MEKRYLVTLILKPYPKGTYEHYHITEGMTQHDVDGYVYSEVFTRKELGYAFEYYYDPETPEVQDMIQAITITQM